VLRLITGRLTEGLSVLALSRRRGDARVIRTALDMPGIVPVEVP